MEERNRSNHGFHLAIIRDYPDSANTLEHQLWKQKRTQDAIDAIQQRCHHRRVHEHLARHWPGKLVETIEMSVAKKANVPTQPELWKAIVTKFRFVNMIAYALFISWSAYRSLPAFRATMHPSNTNMLSAQERKHLWALPSSWKSYGSMPCFYTTDVIVAVIEDDTNPLQSTLGFAH